MRITMLLENQSYPEDVRVRNEAESLAGRGHEVTVIAPRRPGQERVERVNGVLTRRFRLPEGSGVAGLLGEYAVAHLQLIPRGIRELIRGADVVHMHNPPDTLFPVALVARLMGRRAVWDHHDLTPELFEAKFGRSPLMRLLRGAQRASARAAHEAIVTNESQRDAVRAAGADTVTVVRNGPRAATVGGAGRPREGRLNDPRLVYVGELGSQDGVDQLPAILARVRRDAPDATLTVVGDGPCRHALEYDLGEAGLADAVHLTGWVPHERVAAEVGGADICIDPAPCTAANHRSTMIKVSEYLAAGRPVVAFRLEESVRTAGDAALYADDADHFGETVCQLARDGDLRAQLAARALERAPELTWERSERELRAVYDRLEENVEPSARLPVSFIAWTRSVGRPQEIAEALGGEAYCPFPLGIVNKPLVPVRYALSLIQTAAYLLRRRPQAVIATTPPVFPALVAHAYGRLTGVPVVLDSHPESFGLKGDRVAHHLMPLLRWLSARSAANLVTVDELAEQVRGWGGTGQVVHEAPPALDLPPAEPEGERPRVLFIGIYAPDEPLSEVLEAARALPHVDFRVTGDLRKRPGWALDVAPPNVEFTGYLRGDDYARELVSASAVLTLTTRSQSVCRSGYEAVYAERPLVTSDWPALREVFPYAVHVRNNADSIAEGVDRALSGKERLEALAAPALEAQTARWENQLRDLSAVVRAEPRLRIRPIRADKAAEHIEEGSAV